MIPISMIAGSDEAGKGDYFGYIAVACVCCEENFLRKIGARDSKTLSEKKIFELEKKIKENCSYSVISISPQKYNELHKDSGGKYNLNEILGWMHAKAIKEILDKGGVERILVDKFGKEENVLRNLDKELHEKIIFLTEGEKDPAVAAASILARAEFLRKHAALSKKVGMALPLGSTHVKDAGKQLIKKHGRAILREVAKLHFKITTEL
jgi:ribonuclease HIII